MFNGGVRNKYFTSTRAVNDALLQDIASASYRNVALAILHHAQPSDAMPRRERVAAIADVTNVTKEALHALWEAQAGAYDCIFPTMTVGRNPRFKADVPMSSQTIVRLLSLSSKRAGIGHLSAHDLRRTHITQALDNGAPLQDMQAQAGHANPSTTLRYAQPSDAKSRRQRIAF